MLDDLLPHLREGQLIVLRSTVAPGTTSGDHHTPTFQADDAAIPIGMRVMTGLVLDYLGAGARR